MKRLLFGVALASLSAITLTAAPKPPVPSTITLDTPPSSASSTIPWEPKLGEYVTFTVTYPKTLDHYGVRIQVMCYQDGKLVYGEAGPYNQAFLLGGAMSIWYLGDGPATCIADLYYWSYNGSQKFNWLASTEFDATGR